MNGKQAIACVAAWIERYSPGSKASVIPEGPSLVAKIAGRDWKGWVPYFAERAAGVSDEVAEFRLRREAALAVSGCLGVPMAVLDNEVADLTEESIVARGDRMRLEGAIQTEDNFGAMSKEEAIRSLDAKFKERDRLESLGQVIEVKTETQDEERGPVFHESDDA